MNEQIELTPQQSLTETLSVRGPELTGLLAELRGKGANILTFAVTGQNHYEVTFQRNKFSRINARVNRKKENDRNTC